MAIDTRLFGKGPSINIGIDIQMTTVQKTKIIYLMYKSIHTGNEKSRNYVWQSWML